MPKLSIIKRVTLAIILIFNILNGFLRYHYIVNFYDLNDFITQRKKLHFLYPNSFGDLLSSLLQDPRWLSNIYFMAVAIVSTVLTVFLVFGKKMAYIAFWCYVLLLGLCLLFVMVSLVTGNYKIGFGIAQEIKNLAQSPIVSFIIIGLFYFSTIDFKSASE